VGGGGTARPAAASAPDGTATLLFPNIENSSRLNERYGNERWLELLRVHNTI
jgi:class 3 adenylate cyclase